MAIEKDAATAAHWTIGHYRDMFSEKGPPRTVLVLVDENENQKGVHGFLVGRSVGKEWELENVVVAEASRRQGWGARLLHEFLDCARNRAGEAVFLEVRQSNQAARRLYEKSGFEEKGRRKLYHKAPDEDAITYALNLA